MFKKKLSIKAAFSAVVASFLFCLCLGKSAFAQQKCFYNKVSGMQGMAVRTMIFAENEKESPFYSNKVKVIFYIKSECPFPVKYDFDLDEVSSESATYFGEKLYFSEESYDKLRNLTLESKEVYRVEIEALRENAGSWNEDSDQDI